MMVGRRVIWLVVIAIALIVATAIGLESTQEYLMRQGRPLPEPLFGVLGVLLIIAVAGWSMRALTAQLRRNAGASRGNTTLSLAGASGSEIPADHVYRYTPSRRYVVGALGVFLLFLPYLIAASTDRVTPATYVVCFLCAALMFAIDIYLFRFRLRVQPDGIVLSVFQQRHIPFSEMSEINLARTRSGQEIVVLALKNGRAVRFGSGLAQLNDLWIALARHVPVARESERGAHGEL